MVHTDQQSHFYLCSVGLIIQCQVKKKVLKMGEEVKRKLRLDEKVGVFGNVGGK